MHWAVFKEYNGKEYIFLFLIFICFPTFGKVVKNKKQNINI